MDKHKKPKKQKPVKTDELDILRKSCERHNSTDVLGSYTGTSAGDEQPVQDADDL